MKLIQSMKVKMREVAWLVLLIEEPVEALVDSSGHARAIREKASFGEPSSD